MELYQDNLKLELREHRYLVGVGVFCRRCGPARLDPDESEPRINLEVKGGSQVGSGNLKKKRDRKCSILFLRLGQGSEKFAQCNIMKLAIPILQ